MDYGHRLMISYEFSPKELFTPFTFLMNIGSFILIYSTYNLQQRLI